MRKIILITFVCTLFLLPNLVIAGEFNLHTYFPNLIMAPDPDSQDTVYVACGGQSATQITLQVRIKTDNFDPNDYLVGFFIPLEISVDKPGVTLDTGLSATYTGTALQSWDDTFTVVTVASGSGDPSVFPMQVLVGGVDLTFSKAVGPGDHLLANLKFNVSEPTNVCVTGTFLYQGNGLMVVTGLAWGYVPAFVPACCGPVVPTLTEWGLIVFGVLLLGGIFWYLRRRRIAVVRP